MKGFWDYVNQDKSTDDTSLNRMRLSGLFFPPSKKKKVAQFKQSAHLRQPVLQLWKICSNVPIAICFSQIFSPQKELLHGTILHF